MKEYLYMNIHGFCLVFVFEKWMIFVSYANKIFVCKWTDFQIPQNPQLTTQ